jgi:hypothetical protein
MALIVVVTVVVMLIVIVDSLVNDKCKDCIAGNSGDKDQKIRQR